MNKFAFYSLAGALLAVCLSSALASSVTVKAEATEPIYAVGEPIMVIGAGEPEGFGVNHFNIIHDAISIDDIRPAILRSSPAFTYPRIVLASAAPVLSPRPNVKPDPLLRWRSHFVA